MRFTPRSADDINAELKENAKKFAPWLSGTYDFEVMSGQDTTSKSGNDMIVIELAVFNTDGERRMIKDYLLEAMAAKLRHACEACGLVREYETGTLEGFDFAGKTGRVKLKVQPGDGTYGPKNVVADYVSEPAQARAEERAEAKTAARRTPAPAGDIDDEIPF